MQKGIHPVYREATVHCACGNSFKTRSTIGDISVDICSGCHPFFTGKLKFIDTAGRIEKFKNKFAGGYASLTKKKPAKSAEAIRPASCSVNPRSLTIAPMSSGTR